MNSQYIFIFLFVVAAISDFQASITSNIICTSTVSHSKTVHLNGRILDDDSDETFPMTKTSAIVVKNLRADTTTTITTTSTSLLTTEAQNVSTITSDPPTTTTTAVTPVPVVTTTITTTTTTTVSTTTSSSTTITTTTTPSTSTTGPTTTNSSPTTTASPGRKFDGLSFMGGMILVVGLGALIYLVVRYLRRSNHLPYANLR